MDFGYLSEFWNAITAETADTVAWFQSLGNAVGGAVGSVVLAIFHPLMDVIFLLYYLLVVLGQILGNLLTFVYWIWDIFYNFIININLTSSTTVFNSQIITVLQALPAYSYLSTGVAIVFVIFMVQFIYDFAKH